MILCFLTWVLGGLISFSLMAENVSPPQLILGNPNAKREIVVYSALTCHACKLFHETTLKPYLPQNSEYRVIIRHYPLDQKSLPAAVSISCMPNQELSFYEAIFLEQDQFIESDNGEEFLDQLAVRKFGMKKGMMKQCIQDKTQVKEAILKDIERVQEIVDATPTFFTGAQNGDLTKMGKGSGALPADVFLEFLKENKS